jgi:hypothetical protein
MSLEHRPDRYFVVPLLSEFLFIYYPGILISI